jgi:transposase
MREWLPDDHLALFVIDVVATLDLAALHATYRSGAQGRSAYDPEMLFALWVYATCNGVRSSREIERRCRSDIAFRFICANRVPDHATLARFRQRCDPVIEGLFCALLGLCAEAGLITLGLVAIDGTKVAANAALSATHGEATIRAEVRKLLDAAEAADAAEDRLFGERRGDELPDGMDKAGRERLARLQAAAARIEQRAAAAAPSAAQRRAKAEAEDAESVRSTGHHRSGPMPMGDDPVAEAEADLAVARAEEAAALAAFQRARAEADAAGAARPSRGTYTHANARRRRLERRLARLRNAAAHGQLRVPGPAAAKANTTDPDSAIMPTAGGGWVQGYNVQAAVNDRQVVLATYVSDSPTDVQLLEPMIGAAQANLRAAGVQGTAEVVVADAGYWSEANATGPAGDDDAGANGDRGGPAPPDRLIATTKSYKLRRQAREQGETHGPPPPGASPVEAMEHRLRTSEGAALYARRAVTVEPVFGQVKEHQGLRRFLRRGLPAVQAEASMAAFAHNVRKLFCSQSPSAATA